jgi:hypothetical protein
VYSEVIRRYRGAFPVIAATPGQRQQTAGIVAAAVQQGVEALEHMRAAEAQGDQPRYVTAAHHGAAVLAQMHQHIKQVFSPAQQEVLDTFLATLHVRDHAPHGPQHQAGH